MTNVAVIGVGNIGFQHARLYASMEGVNLVGISDINEKIGKKVAKQFKTKYYKNYLDLLKNEKIDAISIAVPTAFHKDVSLEVIPYVKKILIEKPIADNTKNAKKIVKAAKKYKAKISVGYVERFNPIFAELKKILNKEQIGKPISIIIKRVGLFPPNAKNADVVTDLATHDIDILNYFFNTEPKLIVATGGKLLHDNYDYSEILYNYKGIKCFIQTNWITPVKIRSITITGSKGYLEANYITQEITLYKNIYKKTFINFSDFVLKFGKPKMKNLVVTKIEPLKLELQTFLGLEKSGIKLASEKEGLLALELAEKAKNYISKSN